MDARLLDVLHHRGDVGVVRRRRARRRRSRSRSRGSGRRARGRRPALERLADVLRPVADAHRAAAEHVRGPDEHRVADPLGELDRLLGLLDDPPLRAADAEPLEQRAEALAVLGEVDRVERRAHDPVARLLERAREPERRLAAELDHDAVGLLALADGEHLLDPERLEVEPVGGVVVGRDGLRVAVDHHRLVAERAEALGGVDAAVVELDPLADPVRAGAEDHDRAALSAAPRRPRPRSSRSSSRPPRPRRRTSRRGGTTGRTPHASRRRRASTSVASHASAMSASESPSRFSRTQSSPTRSSSDERR